jgi:signal transduction histidine kinase
MWRLRYFTGAGAGGGTLGAGALTGLVGGLIAAGVALLGVSIYFYREHAGEMRSASQKVSFVNQVSHELKTPLTNIRMYAELAADKLDAESDPELGKCLGVVSDESGRLGRLIGNVLTFAKRGRGATLRPVPGDVDEVVATTLDHFRPSLDKAGVEIEWAPGAGGTCSVDADALEQILANLFSNVEKYAASGKSLKVGSSRDGGRVEIVIRDRGPGIRKSEREKVFEPFARLSDALTEGVSGTGIGLSIARDLARLHGGDLVLTEPEEDGGCRFVLTLAAPEA